MDQILFERQLAQPPLPLDPEILEVLPFCGLWGAAAPFRGLSLSSCSCLDAPEEWDQRPRGPRIGAASELIMLAAALA